MTRPLRLARLSLLFATSAAGGCAAREGARELENVVWIDAKQPAAASAAQVPSGERTREPAAPRDGPEPHHFWVLVASEVAERRAWVRVDSRTWEERYPSGAVMRYRVVGRFREAGRIGMIARRLPDGDVEVFIPDLGSTGWPASRVRDGEWRDLGPMHLID